MALGRGLLIIAALAIVAGLLIAFIAPSGGRILDIASATCAIATWVAPPLVLALSRKPKTSLAGVGLSLRFVVVAASLSLVGLSLGIVALAFADGGRWAWIALAAIVAFWMFGALLLHLGDRSRQQVPPAK